MWLNRRSSESLVPSSFQNPQMQYHPYCLFCCFPWALWQNEKFSGQSNKLWDTCRHALWTHIWRVQVGHSWAPASVCIIHECDYCTWTSCSWNPTPDALDTLTLIHTLSAIINWGCWGTYFSVKIWEWVTPKGSQSCPQLAVQERFPSLLPVMDPVATLPRGSVCVPSHHLVQQLTHNCPQSISEKKAAELYFSQGSHHLYIIR